MEFTFSKRAKSISIILMVIGLLSLVVGAYMDPTDHHQKTWANLLVNGIFFFGISLGALFFYALQYATEAAWSVMVKRVYEGIMSYLPIGGITIFIVLLAGSFGVHHIYHWMDPRVYDPDNLEHFDKIIANKRAFLNLPFFWIRAIVYVGTFTFFARYFRKMSLKQDQALNVPLHLKNYRRAALFLVFFAVLSSVMAWDWLMSIDVHWFSTLYGWYVFSGMWVGAMITAVVITLYLKSKGYLPQVNNSHIQDMGKWMFAISFLWSYLWFSQFMLIWYANIPEEVTYFMTRIEEYRVPFFTMFFINFALPMVILMSRDAKRNPKFLITIGALIFLGHWVDTYLLIIPGAVNFGHAHHCFGHIGLSEIGLMLGFLGMFMFVVLRTLTKAPLSPVNHPYLDESIHHSI